jgi:hypothetical protein
MFLFRRMEYQEDGASQLLFSDYYLAENFEALRWRKHEGVSEVRNVYRILVGKLEEIALETGRIVEGRIGQEDCCVTSDVN